MRYQAVCMVEAATPLAVGSGDKDILKDNPIVRDSFDLPFIPATSLAGVMRHTISSFPTNDVFGFPSRETDESTGSRIIFSAAHLLASDNKAADGLDVALSLKNELDKLLQLPLRDHVRINHKGVATGHGKFESELLPKGVRFVFELELWGTEDDKDNWNDILDIISHPMFRIGGGTRKGFGELKVVKIWERQLDMKNESDLNKYLDKTAQIVVPKQDYNEYRIQEKSKENLVHYQLKLRPRDFFLFDGQFDAEYIEQNENAIKDAKLKTADMTPKTEKIICWKGDKPVLSESKWLIPATSVKGAISHRVAFNYNKLTKFFANQEDSKIKDIQKFIANTRQPTTEEEAIQLKKEIENYLNILKNNEISEGVGEENTAVKTLFGESLDVDKKKGQRGRVFFSDIYLNKDKTKEKALNHVSIDRFTGGAMDTALFSEMVIATEEGYTLDVYVEVSAFSDDIIIHAFETTLKELVNEQLPIGGGVMRGHGMMKGSLTKNGEAL
jgi:CRISPR/Cas system CMR subunit Cmr4 (Cas7 group RAMP superfamily)